MLINRNYVHYIFILLIITIYSPNSLAIVNMENIHLGKPPMGFQGNLDLNINAEFGNTEKMSADTGIKLQWTDEKEINYILASYEYGESASVKDKNNTFIHARHIKEIDSRYDWEVFSQLSTNEFTKLNMRALLGGGARISFGLNNKKSIFKLGLGGFYEREELDIDKTIGLTETNNTVRANIYLVFKYQFNSNVAIVSSTYYQPALDEFSDYRATENLVLSSSLTDKLILKTSLNVSYDSEPPPGIEQYDGNIRIGIDYEF